MIIKRKVLQSFSIFISLIGLIGILTQKAYAQPYECVSPTNCLPECISAGGSCEDPQVYCDMGCMAYQTGEGESFGILKHPLPKFQTYLPGVGLGEVLNNVISFATYIAGIALLGYLIYGGFSWITAAGNEERVEKAQKTISNAVIGLVIVVAAIIITQILGNVLGFENILKPTFPGAGSTIP